MKKTTAIILALLFALALLVGCSEREPAVSDEYGCADYYELAQTALLLAKTGDVELIKKLLPKGEIEFNTARFAEKDQDYFELLRQDFAAANEAYTAAYGEDYELSYTFTECRDKDAEGIQKYRDFDAYYFESYGIDAEKIEAVSYLYAEVTASGASASYTKEKSLWVFKYEGRWYSFYMPTFGLYVVEKSGQ